MTVSKEVQPLSESQHGIVGIRIIYLIRNVLLHGVADDTGVADGAILLAPS